jgi:hypothetical protein
MSNDPIDQRVAQFVLLVHRRNGGTLEAVDGSLRLLDPRLGIDSLDLAEIMVAIERETGASPFDVPQPPRTWGDVAVWFQSVGRQKPAAESEN